MTKSNMSGRLSLVLAVFLLLGAPGAVFAQGGSSGGASSTGSAGTQGAGSSGSNGTSSAVPESTKKKPMGTGDSAVQPTGTTSRTSTKKMVESGAGATKVASIEKTFESWLGTSKEGLRLRSVYDRLRNSAKPALAAGVPIDAFKARIREAVAKGAAPDIVAAALEADAERWIWLANLIENDSWPPARSAAGFYLSVASALRNGLSETAVRDLVEWAKVSRIAPERAGAALTVAASICTSLGTGSAHFESVARLLAASKLKIGQYDSVTALANRALATGLSADRIVATLEKTLGEGLSFADLEKILTASQ